MSPLYNCIFAFQGKRLSWFPSEKTPYCPYFLLSCFSLKGTLLALKVLLPCFLTLSPSDAMGRISLSLARSLVSRAPTALDARSNPLPLLLVNHHELQLGWARSIVSSSVVPVPCHLLLRRRRWWWSRERKHTRWDRSEMRKIPVALFFCFRSLAWFRKKCEFETCGEREKENSVYEINSAKCGNYWEKRGENRKLGKETAFGMSFQKS